MKIGLVCPYSFDVPGGVQIHVRDLAQWLLAQGHEVRVLAPAGSRTPVPEYVDSAGPAVPVRYNGSVARINFGTPARLRVARWLEQDFDLVHVHEPMTPSISILSVWAAEQPLVATFHTAMERSRALQTLNPLLRPSLEKIVGRIAVSEAARQTARWHVGGETVVIPNGVTTATFATAPVRPDWAGVEGGPTIVFVGRMEEPRKGFGVLAEALPALLGAFPGLRLLVAGPGDVDAARELIDESAWRCVEFLGRVTDSDKASLLRSADLYVAPNLGGESFGIILVEAMAAGAPVLASDLDAFSAVLARGAAGELFRVGDAADLAVKAVRLLGDTRRRRALCAAGRERAASYDWEVVGRSILGVYETVLLGSPQPESERSVVTRLAARRRRPDAR